MRKLYNFEEQLKTFAHTWNGDYKNEDNEWVANDDPTMAMMDKETIKWCVSTLETYTGSNYVATQFSAEDINNVMRAFAKNVNYNLSKRWKNFRNALEIPNVTQEMVNFVYSILKGSFGDGQRKLIGTATNYTVNELRQPKQGGFFSKGNKKLFGGNEGVTG